MVLQPSEGVGRPDFSAFKQFGMIANFAELHNKIHETAGGGRGRTGGGRGGGGGGQLDEVLVGNLVLDGLVEHLLTSRQRTVDKNFNLERCCELR